MSTGNSEKRCVKLSERLLTNGVNDDIMGTSDIRTANSLDNRPAGWHSDSPPQRNKIKCEFVVRVFDG